tara:strand:+ start:171 stop:1331 length:1161 start_codon:yes stop_codon:yes gene_type:complete
MKNITVVGLGYVGTSIAILLAQNNKVTCLDIDESKINKINNRLSPIVDLEVSEYLKHKKLNVKATSDSHLAYTNADFVIIATPTDFNEETNFFNTTSVENVIKNALESNPETFIVVKSTVPIGFISKLKIKYKTQNIIFSPEFLREGKALYDNLYPSRIVIGGDCKQSKEFANLLDKSALKKDIESYFMSSDEAEAVKLFSNTYLALRVSFFNELDTFGMIKKLDSRKIINAVSSDNRIGNDYNNPSFGYGGYCLPKDTKQLLTEFDQIPQKLIKAVVESNATRKDAIALEILNLNPKIVGIYKLSMKSNSDNSRFSAVIGIIKRLKGKVKIVLFDNDNNDSSHIKRIKNINEFKNICDVIIANRIDEQLLDISNKVFTRDIFNRD